MRGSPYCAKEGWKARRRKRENERERQTEGREREGANTLIENLEKRCNKSAKMYQCRRSPETPEKNDLLVKVVGGGGSHDQRTAQKAAAHHVHTCIDMLWV